MEQHPALKNFNSTWESVKIIGAKALKWAAVSALVVGIPLMVLGSTSAVVLPFTMFEGVKWGGLTALKIGGAAGAVMGAISGVGGLAEELDNSKRDAIADYEQALASRQRTQIMANSQGQGVPSMGASPNVGGYGRGQGAGVRM